MSKERMLAPPISTVGTMIRTMPATRRDCGLMPLLSSLLRMQEGKRLGALQCSRGLYRCALAWGLLLLDDQLPYVQPANLELIYVEALDPSALDDECPDRQGADC